MGECSFWYRPTRVVPDQRPLNGRCCCCCCSPKRLDRRLSLTSFGGTRAALSWSTCCIRHNSGTERGTSRKSRFHRTWAVSDYASVSRARGYRSQMRMRTSSRLAMRAAISCSIANVDFGMDTICYHRLRSLWKRSCGSNGSFSALIVTFAPNDST